MIPRWASLVLAAGGGFSCSPSGGLATETAIHGTQCGPNLEFIPVNAYMGDLEHVDTTEEAVVWVGSTCTGTYVATAAEGLFLVLSAGHCARLGETVPVTFNYELSPDGPEIQVEGTVVERADVPDYALIELHEDPGVAPVRLVRRASIDLVVMQHPVGQPKVLAKGRLTSCGNGRLRYADADTLTGSSGAGVLNRWGGLFGIHTEGDCARDGSGSNGGWLTATIIETSAILSEADLARE